MFFRRTIVSINAIAMKMSASVLYRFFFPKMLQHLIKMTSIGGSEHSIGCRKPSLEVGQLVENIHVVS